MREKKFYVEIHTEKNSQKEKKIYDKNHAINKHVHVHTEKNELVNLNAPQGN